MSEYIDGIKVIVINIILCSGIASLLKGFRDELASLFDGGTQISMSDAVVAIILCTIIWRYIGKWIIIKKG